MNRSFARTPGFRRYFANTGWLFLDHFLRLGVGFVVGVWIARYLGPEQFGILSYAIAFVTLFSVLSKLGLDGVIVRELVRQPELSEELLGTAFLLKLVGAILLVLLSCLAIWLLRPDDGSTRLLVLVVAVGTLFQAFEVIDFYFQSQVMAKTAVIAKDAAYLVCTVLKVVLLVCEAPLVAFAAVGSVEIFFTAVALTSVFHLRGKRIFHFKSSLAQAGRLMKDSWPLILQGLAIVLYMRIDQVMLGELADPYQVGIYSVAVRLTEVWYIVPWVISSSLFPAIIRSRELGEAMYMERIQNFYTMMIWISLAVSVIVTFLAPLIISVTFGDVYRESAFVLALQIWGGCAVFFGTARSKWLLAENRQIDNLYVQLCAVVINVAGNVVLIPRLGAKGASIVSLITVFSCNFVAALFVKSIRLSLIMYGRSLLAPLRFILARASRA